MSWQIIYLWTRLDGVCIFLEIMTILCGIGLVVVGFIYFINVVEDDEDVRKSLRPWTIATVVLFFLFAFTRLLLPTSKDFAMMYAIPKIVESKMVKEDLPELYDMAIKALNEKIADEKEKPE